MKTITKFLGAACVVGLGLASTLASTTALAQEKIKIGVSYPTPTHAWAAGMNWHAEQAEKRLEALYPDVDLILVNSPDPEAQASALEDLVSVHQIKALVVLPFESEPLTDPVLNVKKSGAWITVVDRGLILFGTHWKNAKGWRQEYTDDPQLARFLL